MAKKTVMIVGATGLVGTQLVDFLANDDTIEKIVCLVRRPVTTRYNHVQFHVVNFMAMDQYHDLFLDVSAVFCCVGTTMKQAKTREQFQIVDPYIPKVVARLAHEHHVPSFSLVSSVGANPSSRSFYLMVKGQIEKDIKAIGFPSFLIYRPSLLLGKRSHLRWGELTMGVFFKLFFWLIPRQYRPTDSTVLAKVISQQFQKQLTGIHIFEPHMIQ